MEDYTEDQLMEALKEGREEALNELVRRCQNKLFQFFCHLGQSPSEAEDMVQETFIKVYKSAQNYRGQGRFFPWLYTLARHLWIDKMRKREISFSPLPDEDLHPLHPSSREEDDPSQNALQKGVAQLSEKLKMVLVLKIYQGLKYEEISQVLDIPTGTVKSRMHLAIGRLKKDLHHFAEGENWT